MLELTGTTTGSQRTDNGRALAWAQGASSTKGRSWGAVGEVGHLTDDKSLGAAILAGNEAAFEVLLERLSPSMFRVARSIVSDREVAEEVVQETWIAVLKGLERFEGRSSLKTWIFSILTNRARTTAKRERRTLPFSSLCEVVEETERLAADADKFKDDRHAWMAPRQRSRQTPEDRLLSTEALAVVREELRVMSSRQAEVVTLRDVEGWTAAEVCQSLGISESNQRVLLHRGRGCIRKAFERYANKPAAA